jgi:hypothetical protein
VAEGFAEAALTLLPWLGLWRRPAEYLLGGEENKKSVVMDSAMGFPLVPAGAASE